MKKFYPTRRYLLAVLFVFAAILTSHAQPSGWSFIQAISISENSDNDLTDYQVKLTFNTQTLIAAGQMNPDGSDMRFGSNCPGTLQYSYYIESGINTPSTVVWVKVPFLTADDFTTIYMYYGNPAAAPASDLTLVFSGPNSITDSVTGSNTGSAAPSQRGIEFSPNVDVLVTSFGKNEPSGTDRFITLFDDATTNIIAQQIVTGSDLDYDYTDLPSPIWLTAGTNYEMELHTESGDQYYTRSTQQHGEDITYIAGKYCNNCDENAFPGSTLPNSELGFPDMWYWTKQQVDPEPTFEFVPIGVNVTISAQGPTTFCPGQSVDLVAGGALTYLWSTTETTGTITVSTADTYTVTGTDNNGCTASASQNVDLFTAPVVDLGGPYNQCSGTTTTLDAGSWVSYIWSDGTTTTETFVVPFDNTWSVTVTDDNSCTGSASATVTSFPSPVISFTGSTQLCAGTVGALTAVAPGSSFAWSTGDATATIPVAPLTTYTVTATDGNTCTASATTSVSALSDFTVSGNLQNGDGVLSDNRMYRSSEATSCGVNSCPGPYGDVGCYFDSYSVTNNGGTDICANLDLTSACAFDVFAAVYLGSYNPADICANYLGDAGSSGTTSFTFTIPANSTVVIAISGVNQATDCAGYTLAVTGLNSGLAITPSGSTTFCSGGSVDLTASGGNGAYNWSTGSTSPTITATTSNTYTVSSTNVNNCSISTSQVVTVNPTPVPTNVTGYTACEGTTIPAGQGLTATSSVVTGLTQTITFTITNQGADEGTSSPGVDIATINLPGLPAGATVTDATININGITLQDASYASEVRLELRGAIVNPGAQIAATDDIPNVFDGSFTIPTAAIPTTPGVATMSYFESFDDIPTQDAIFPATGTLTITYDAPGNLAWYTASSGGAFIGNGSPIDPLSGAPVTSSAPYFVQTTLGVCQSTRVEADLTMNPKPVVDLGGPYNQCGGTLVLDAGSFVSYLWDDNSTAETRTVNGSGTYSVTVTDGNGCTGSGSVGVVYHPAPVVNLGGPYTQCSGTVTLNAGNFVSYHWDNNTTNQFRTVNSSGNYSVTVTDGFACTGSGSASVTINQNPVVNLGGPYVQCGGFVLLDPGFFEEGYHWNDNTTNEVKIATVTGPYSVTVTDGNGCTGSGSTNVTIYTPPTVDLGGPYEQCQGSVVLDAGNPGSTYIWSDGTTTTQTLAASVTGDYAVTVTDQHNCTGSSITTVTIDLPPLNTTGYSLCQGDQVPAGDGFTASGCGDVSPSFAGRTTFQDPTFNRGQTGTTYNPSVVGTAVHYNTHTFEVGTSGSYTFTMCGDFDTYLHIYQNSFNDVFPATNFMVADDDAGNGACGGFGSLATVNLTAGVEYVFVATGYNNTDVGDYNVTFTGPGPVYEGPLNQVLWFSQANGGPLVGTGSPFNPVGTTTLPNTNTPGTYTFYAACPNTAYCRTPVQFVVKPAPTVNLGGPYNQCGGTVTLDAGPGNTTYTWSDGSSAQTTIASTSGLYSVTVMNGSACSASGSANVYLQQVPVVNLGLDHIQCGGTVTLDAGNPGNQYTWSDNSHGQTLTVNSTGTYSVTVGDINTNCTASDAVDVTINTAPTVNLGGPYQQCGGTVTLNAGNVGATYLWSTNAVTQTVTVGVSGIYRVTVTNGNSCSATGSAQVTINSYPSLGPDKTDSVCPGYTVDLYSYYPNNAYTTYTWNTADPTAVGAGTYTLIISNAAGCADTAVAVITNRQQPNLGPDLVDSICIGYTYDLWSLYPNNPSYASYVWTTPTPQEVVAGTYTLIVSNFSGCSDTLMATISYRQQPNLGPDNADSVCAGYFLHLTDYFPNTGYETYTWTPANNDTVGPGVYTLIVSNTSGCSDTAVMTITNRQQPVVTLNMAHEMCYTEPAFALTGGMPAGGTYMVDDTLVTDSIDPVAIGIGSHHINYTFTNASGCTDSASITFVVHPQPNITTVAPPDLCTGSQPMDLNNYFTPLGGVFSGFGVSQHFFYPSLTGAIDSNLITYNYTDQFGCKDTSIYPVSVKNTVHVSLVASEVDFTICRGDNVTFTASGAEVYEFFVNGVSQGVATTTDSFATTSLANHDEVYVVGSNSCSTDTSESIFIDVITQPVVNAGPDTTITLGQSVVLNTTASGATQLTYVWTPDYFLNFANVPNPTYSGPDTTTFAVKVMDNYGCWGTDTITVNVYVPNNILLPNILTPDGDGKNDKWILNYKINLDGSSLIVFNRWGETVFEATSYTNDWDGTYKGTGKKLPDDTYYYVLKVPAQDNHIYKGAINILNGSTK